MRRGRRSLLATALCVAGAVAWPAAAAAVEVSAAQLRELARASPQDPGALARLRSVDRVDGRPVSLRRALDAPPAQLRERLRVLALAPAAQRPAAGARAAARDVLAQRRFRPSSFPRPLRGLMERIGGVIGRPLVSAFNWLASLLPGGRPTAAALLAGALLAGTALLAGRAHARRGSDFAARAADAGGGERVSAARLLAQAERAERAGELDEALRLRFRAGLVELDSRDLIELRPALTNSEITRAVASPTLGGLVAGFEAVAYGGRPADADDLRSARDGWPRVVQEAAPR